MNNKKNFNLFLGIGIIIVLSLYFVWAAATAPKDLLITNNVTFLYDEGNFFVNWSSGGGEGEGNYTVHIWMHDFHVSANVDANDSVTGYQHGLTLQKQIIHLQLLL